MKWPERPREWILLGGTVTSAIVGVSLVIATLVGLPPRVDGMEQEIDSMQSWIEEVQLWNRWQQEQAQQQSYPPQQYEPQYEQPPCYDGYGNEWWPDEWGDC